MVQNKIDYSQIHRKANYKSQIKEIFDKLRVIIKNTKNTPEIKLNQIYLEIENFEKKF